MPRVAYRRPWRITATCVGIVIACALVAGAAPAQQTGRDAQRKLERVQRELKRVADERRKLEGERGAASRQLRSVDENVANSSRALHEAEAQLQRERDAMQQLQTRREDLRAEHGVQQQQLAALLRAAYAQGGHAPLKLALAQDRMADVNRQLAYYGYLQKRRLQRSVELSNELQELRRVEQQVAQKQSVLDAARDAQQARLTALNQDRQARAATLGELEQRYRDRRERERALGSDAKALQQVISRLRATAARAAAERAAAERAAARAARNTSKPGATATPKPSRPIATAAPVRVGGFGWPLSGNLIASYGGRMPDGRASTGLLIAAGMGTPVRAVADGTVVFAEWMTGYGLILIVDHGNGYLSLYAHNESLLKDVGVDVKRGDAVARVGNSGGLEQPGLYFELRHNGQPVNPNSWLKRQ